MIFPILLAMPIDNKQVWKVLLDPEGACLLIYNTMSLP